MKIWEIIFLVLAIVIYVWYENFKAKSAQKYKINIPLFSPQQLHEFLKQRGPQSVADAFEINKADYDYGWNNVLKAASILGDAKGTDQTEAVKQLISNLKVDEPNLVAISAVSLGKLKNPLALPHLEKLINSQPNQSEMERQKSLQYEKSQRENYAQRIGATLTNYPSISDPQEKHKKIREAALWAISEIKNAEFLKSEKIRTSESMDVSEAFEVFRNQKNFSIGKTLQAAAVLSNAKGSDVPKAIQQLISNLTDTESNLALISVISLGKIGDSSVITRLNKLLEEISAEQEFLRTTIAFTISEIYDRIK